MVNYRRNLVPGGTFFFTVALRNRRSHWLTEYITELGGALRNTRNTRPFWIDAIVVLPDHLHTIWTLPPGDVDYPGRWKAIKSRLPAHWKQELGKRKDGSALVWQRRYWEHTVRNDEETMRI